MKKAEFRKRLLNLLGDATMCGIQYRGCPCGTCLTTFMCDELGLDEDRANQFWRCVLIIRGDYTEKQMRKYEKEDE